MASIFDPLINDPEDEAQNKALIAALRAQTGMGIVGQGMGLQATQQIGQGLQRGAQQSFSEAMQAREAAKRQKIVQAQMQADAAQRSQAQQNWQQNYSEQQRQFGIQQDAAKRQFSAVVDPITGAMRMYNTFTGEWQDGRGGTPPPAAGKPMGPTGFPQLPQGIKMPENATKSYIGASMLAEHLPALEGMLASGYTPDRKDLMAVGPPMSGPAGRLQDITPRDIAGGPAQQYFAVGGKILTAILRPESGGAITQDEWNQYGPLYLPWPGDDPDTRSKKMIALREYMRRLAAGSGPASNYFQEPPVGSAPQPGAPLSEVGAGPAAPRPGDKYLPPPQ
jgi:hypothetical protein